MQYLEPEGLVRGEEERRVLEVHVGASGPGLSVAALEEHDLFRDAGGDGRSKAALAGGDAGEVRRVALAKGSHAADRVSHHLVGHGCGGGGEHGGSAQDESREDRRAGMALDAHPRHAERMCFNVEDTEPGAELVNQIKVGPGGPADRGVVALALGVVLAF